MRPKLLTSIALIFGATAVMVVVGLPAFFATWLAVLGLFLYSRLAERAVIFSEGRCNNSGFEYAGTVVFAKTGASICGKKLAPTVF